MSLLPPRCIRVLGWIVVLVLQVRGASIDPLDFFKSRIRPILVNQCYACHTVTKMGGLQLDSREQMLEGGNSGPAVVPGKPDESLLIRAVSHTHERLKMPPQGKLTDEQIADLRTWVADGVHWADDSAAVSTQPKEYGSLRNSGSSGLFNLCGKRRCRSSRTRVGPKLPLIASFWQASNPVD